MVYDNEVIGHLIERKYVNIKNLNKMILIKPSGCIIIKK